MLESMPNNLVGKKSKVTTKTVYQKRTDLTRDEIRAINHYKDLINPQYSWDYPVAKKELSNLGIDCYMVNNVLRGTIPQTSLSLNDKKRVGQIIMGLGSAIRKSTVKETVMLMKGLSDSSWIEQLKEGDVFIDSAFGSYTASYEIARRYAKKNKYGFKLYLSLELDADDLALFVDDDEKEYILPMGQTCTIIRRKTSFEHREIIYYIERR